MAEEQYNRNCEDLNISENISIKDKRDENEDINNQKKELTESGFTNELIENDNVSCKKADSGYVNKLMSDEDVVMGEKSNEEQSTSDNFNKNLQDGTKGINNQIDDTCPGDHISNVQENADMLCNLRRESKLKNSTARSGNNSQLQKNSQKLIEDIEVRTKDCSIKDSEMRCKSDKSINNSAYSVNFQNKGISQINLITDPKPIAELAPHWRQFLAAMGPYLMILAGGLSCGFSATLLPQLKKEHSVILINEQSPSWIASMAALPMAPGCFIGGWLMEKLGRRQALCILSIPFFVGWVLIASAPSLPFMLMGRFLNGLSIGVLAPPMSVFISETSTPKLRGMFLAFLSFNLALGIFIAHIIGTWVSWQWTAIICAFFPFFSAGLLVFIPESPVWLFSKGRSEDAIKAFYWLRGCGEEVDTELRALIDKFKYVDATSSEPWTKKMKNFYTPTFLKPLLLVTTINITCQFAGIHTITFYSVDILETAVGKGMNSYLAMLIIDFLRIITTIITIFTSRKCPRRTLCIISGCLTTFSFVGLSGFLYVYDNNIPTHLSVIPLCLLSAYVIAINIGLMPLPWIIVGEIFPARFRSFGAGLASAIGYLSTFVVVKTAPGMMVNLGQVTTFMFYATVSLVGTVVLFFIMPETKGKTLLDIEKMFEKNNLKSNI